MAALSSQQVSQYKKYLLDHKMSMKAIFAVDENCYLGYGNDLIFKNKEDLKFFRSKTINQCVIMGRKTFDSMGGKPLPDRLNIVLTSDPDGAKAKFKSLKVPGVRRLKFISDYMQIPSIMHQRNMKTGWVIGGASVLKDLQPVCGTFIITEYRCKLTEVGQVYGLLPPDKPEDYESFDPDKEYYDPEKIVRVSDYVRKIRSSANAMRLTPTQYFKTPSGDMVPYCVQAWVRPNPASAAKIAALRAEEAMEHEAERARKAEMDVVSKIRRRF